MNGTPALMYSISAAAAEPARSTARQASATTLQSRPARLPSSAE